MQVDRSTLAHWVGFAAFELAPLHARLLAILKASTKLFADETRCPVLDPGRGKTKTGYLWAMARDDRPRGGADRPVGVVFWGFVDDEVQKRLETQAGGAKLRPQDWKSGDNLWVVDVIAPFGGGDEMVKDLKLKVYPDRPIKTLATEDGKLTVRVI